MPHTNPILTIETLALNAWPAAEVVELDGWRLRAADGVTGRANSVWPNLSHGQVSLETKLTRVEEFYRQRGLPIRYQITPACLPADLDSVLADYGYAQYDNVAVQIAEISAILANAPPLRLRPEFEVQVSEEFDDEWFVVYRQAEEVSDHAAAVRQGILQRIANPTAFATLRIEGQLAAIALGVVEAGWLGIFNVETRPEFRRRGAGLALMRTLAIWGQMNGANGAYLQVVAANQPARAMYEKTGFTTLYHYHYRIKASG